jgi:hypothetical protein
MSAEPVPTKQFYSIRPYSIRPAVNEPCDSPVRGQGSHESGRLDNNVGEGHAGDGGRGNRAGLVAGWHQAVEEVRHDQNPQL